MLVYSGFTKRKLATENMKETKRKTEILKEKQCFLKRLLTKQGHSWYSDNAILHFVISAFSALLIAG